MNLILRIIFNAIALYAAVAILPGVTPQNPSVFSYLWLAVIFGVLNALVRPILKLLTCPLIILTLGLFTLVINTVMFRLAGYVGAQFGVGFRVDDWFTAFLGGLIVSVISVILTSVLPDEKEMRRKSE